MGPGLRRGDEMFKLHRAGSIKMDASLTASMPRRAVIFGRIRGGSAFIQNDHFTGAETLKVQMLT